MVRSKATPLQRNILIRRYVAVLGESCQLLIVNAGFKFEVFTYPNRRDFFDSRHAHASKYVEIVFRMPTMKLKA